MHAPELRHAAFATAVAAIALTLPPHAPSASATAARADGAAAANRAEGLEQSRPTRVGRTVFVCTDALPVTFADRPCSPGAELRQLRVLEPPPGRAPSLAPAVSSASTRPAPSHPATETDAADPHAERCRVLLEQRGRLNDRMRAGYSARQAGQLWNRWRDLGREIYAARC